MLKKMVEIIGYREGLPVVTDPGILNPKEFIDQVINVRIPNPFMPDTPKGSPLTPPKSWRSALAKPLKLM